MGWGVKRVKYRIHEGLDTSQDWKNVQDTHYEREKYVLELQCEVLHEDQHSKKKWCNEGCSTSMFPL